MQNKKNALNFISKLISAYSCDKISTWSAALSYYTIFSIAPILLIILTTIGFFLGTKNAEARLISQMNSLLGNQISLQIQTIISNAQLAFESHAIKFIGIALLIFAATGFFNELQGGLNYIWRVELKSGLGIFKNIKNRILSFVLVLFITFLLFSSIVISAILNTISVYFTHYLGIDIILERSLDFFSSLFLVAILTSLLFRVLPDVIIRWKEVIIGACITSLLFNIGKMLLNTYLSYSNIGSIFGAAGSLVAFLVWIYYSAQIFYIGALVTKILALQGNNKILLKQDAKFIHNEQH